MLPSAPSTGTPLLSILIFAPLAAAAVAVLIKNERALRWWTLAVTTLTAAFSLRLYSGFNPETAGFQFVERAPWIPSLRIEYILGVDGLSLLLILLTTLLAPLCVLAHGPA